MVVGDSMGYPRFIIRKVVYVFWLRGKNNDVE
jgi:hypothetical protein